MRKSLLFVGIILTLTFGCDKSENLNELPCSFVDFSYYDDEPQLIGEMSEDYILVGINSDVESSIFQELVNSKRYLDQNYNYEINSDAPSYKYIGLKLLKNCSCEEIAWILEDLKKNSIILFAHYTIFSDDCTNLGFEPIGDVCVRSYSTYFYVKVKDVNDLSSLNETISETNTLLHEQNEFMNNWFTIYADKNSNGDACQMANYFYETGLFEACEPDIIQIVVE
jgi:hypothetical protein